MSKKHPKTLRLIIASVVGGFYSLIIFADGLSVFLLSISKIIASAIIVLIAYKFYRVKSFVVTYALFLISNFILLGVIIGFYLLTKSQYIVVNNSIVYFDISARGLLLCAFVAYLISCIVVKIYNRTLSKNEIYKIVIENKSKSVSLFALADTGNKLYEPFSNSPVIVADKNIVEKIAKDSIVRIIPATTVNDSSFLQGFKPDKVIIKTSKGDEVIDNVYIAMSENMNENGFSAVINPEILSV